MKIATQRFIEAEDSDSEYDQSEGQESQASSHLSEQIFEMCQMFSQQRPDIEEFARGFSISKTIQQLGEQ